MPQVSRALGRAIILSLGIVLLGVGSLSSQAAEPKKILLLHSYGQEGAPLDAFVSSFRTEMLRTWPEKAALYDFSLETGRPEIGENEGAVIQVLRARFAAMKLDLVVMLGAQAARFYTRNREELFPGVPILVVADQRTAPVDALKRGDSVVGIRLSAPQAVKGILELLPETTTIALIFGSSSGERFWAAELRKDLASFEGRVKFVWLDNLLLSEVREQVAALRPGAVALYVVFQVDAAGIPYNQEYAIREIHAASKVPLFGLFENQVGQGMVGGALISGTEQAVVAAGTASRVLRGEAPQEAAIFLGPTAPQFDWRELQRWHIDDDRLPPGSAVRFRPPSMWAEYKFTVLASFAVLLFQAALIIALVVQRVRRQRAEHEAFSLSRRLLTAHEDERRRLARELHDDVTQRLARLAIDAARIEKTGPHARDGAPQSLHRGLVRLSEDMHALSYRLHPSILDDLGLAEALKAECEHVSRREPVRVEVELDHVPDGLPNDVALCIFRVVQEALRNIARHARASVAIVSLAFKDGGLLLAIRDNGVGFDVDATQSRHSLGRAGMGERVRILGGTFGIKSAFGQGTTVSAWVPLKVASS
jgi:two-component sensor histidine kinase